MIPADFLKELRAIRSNFDWFLSQEGRIRAISRSDAGNRVFNPITAVVFAQTGRFFTEGTWSEAAAVIGISVEDCADFVSACNFAWEPTCRQGLIRNDVLDAISLETEALSDKSTSAFEMFIRNFRKRSTRPV